MKKLKTLQKVLYLSGLIFLILGSANIVSGQWTCGDDLIDNRDGQSYKTIQIGSQCWMAENLNYGTMIQSNAAGHQMSDNSIVEKYCWNNILSNCDNSTQHPGGYYEWQEAVQYYGGQPTLPVKGICPDEWHIPSQAEYSSLITELGGAAVAGGKLKVGGTSGFEGVIAGWRCTINGRFLTLFPKGFWWSGNMQAADEGVYMDIDETNSAATISAYPASIGFNIRCLKNTTSGTSELIDGQNKFRIENFAQEGKLLNLSFITESIGDYIVTICDLTGKEVSTNKIYCQVGENILSIQLDGINSGIYILNLEYKDQAISQKFYIQ